MKTKKNILSYLIAVLLMAFITMLSFFLFINYSTGNNSNVEGGLEEYFENGDKTTSSGYDLKQAEDKGDGVYDLSKDAYNNNTDFIITDLTGLKAFAGIVNGNKRDFDGKRVHLNSDISCGGDYLTIGFTHYVLGVPSSRYFKGDLFNGNNRTISNFKIRYFLSQTKGTPPFIYKYYGFFTTLSENCEIKNLKLKNFSVESDSSSNARVGGVVGLAASGVQINNCIVEDFEGGINLSGGICGTTENSDIVPIIENCLVNNATIDYGLIADYSNYIGKIAVQLKSCVVNANMAEDALYLNNHPNKSIVSASNCISTSNTTSGLSCSSIGGNTALQSTTLYYATEYNNGFPYLRQFITGWKHVYFNVDNGTLANSSPSMILIPNDALEPACTSTSPSIKIFNRDITATTSLCHSSAIWSRCSIYEEWGISIYMYTCTFSVLTRTIQFPTSPNVTLTVNNTPKSNTQHFNVACGITINCSTTTYSNQNGIYKSVTYNFLDVNNNTQTIKYTTEGTKFYISNMTLNETTEIHADLILDVTIALKSYKITMK